MPDTDADPDARCITCGAPFEHTRRYGGVVYIGSYCEQHDKYAETDAETEDT